MRRVLVALAVLGLAGAWGCARRFAEGDVLESEKDVQQTYSDHVVMARFGDGRFPVTVTEVVEREGGIEFGLQKGPRHVYRHPSWSAFDFTLVRCEDRDGRERVWLLRTRDEVR